jgi:hypothetical protein
MSRSGAQRLNAIVPAMERRDEFLARVDIASGDSGRLADLMAEAIGMLYDANGLETVGGDGRVTVCIEEVVAAHCMFGVREAYLKAREQQRSVATNPPSQPRASVRADKRNCA